MTHYIQETITRENLPIRGDHPDPFEEGQIFSHSPLWPVPGRMMWKRQPRDISSCLWEVNLGT